MNYAALQWLINSILSSYTCEKCHKKAETDNINITALEKNSIILEFTCPSCGQVSYIKSQMMSIDITKHLSQDQIALLEKKIWWKKKKLHLPKITDTNIVELNKDLKKENINVSDLFKNN